MNGTLPNLHSFDWERTKSFCLMRCIIFSRHNRSGLKLPPYNGLGDGVGRLFSLKTLFYDTGMLTLLHRFDWTGKTINWFRRRVNYCVHNV